MFPHSCAPILYTNSRANLPHFSSDCVHLLHSVPKFHSPHSTLYFFHMHNTICHPLTERTPTFILSLVSIPSEYHFPLPIRQQKLSSKFRESSEYSNRIYFMVTLTANLSYASAMCKILLLCQHVYIPTASYVRPIFYIGYAL